MELGRKTEGKLWSPGDGLELHQVGGLGDSRCNGERMFYHCTGVLLAVLRIDLFKKFS